VIVVTFLVVALAVVVGIGWYFSGVAMAVGDHRPDLVAKVVAVTGGDAAGAEALVLSRQRETELPGSYGLEWTGGYGQVGPALSDTADGVTRPFTPRRGTPTAGTAVGLDPGLYHGDPRSELGLPFEEVTVRSDVGDLPTWYVPAATPAPGAGSDSASATAASSESGSASGRTWGVFVHGHDSSRQEALRYLTFLHARGMPVVVPSIRNDVGAPAGADHADHLGGTEWRDVEAAVRWALGHGAHDVVLFGWSMGGAVDLQMVDRSALRDAVRGLVLDSPVLDWRSVLDHQGDLRGLPRPITAVALRLIELRLGIDLNRFDWPARAGSLTKPMMVVHSAADGYVPNGPSLALRRERPDLVTYLDVPGADHTRAWNVDPVSYRAALGDWLTKLGV
jgi:dienelactone hydrolase